MAGNILYLTFVDKLIQTMESLIYDKKSRTSNLYAFIETMSKELQDVSDDLTIIHNDNYICAPVTGEEIIKGEKNGMDYFQNFTVVDIRRVGDTLGADDYIRNVDYEINERGIEWKVPEYLPIYGYGYGYGGHFPYGSGVYNVYNPYYPWGRKEPETNSLYYVDYCFGVRNEKLYEIFGAMTKLKKRDYQDYTLYRKAVKMLGMALLAGPSIPNIKQALSVFIPIDNVDIRELFRYGWILGENTLYTESEYNNSYIDTTDGTILLDDRDIFDWEVHLYNAPSDLDRQIIEDILQIMKPAHTTVTSLFLTRMTRHGWGYKWNAGGWG